jgi:general stress protein CsbA
MIAWKTAQAAINIMKFYENIVKYLVPAITSASLAIRKQLAASLIAAQLNFGKFGLAITAVTAQTLGFAAAIGLAFAVFTKWEYMNGMQKIVSVLGVLTVALLSAAIAFGAFHSAWSLGIAAAGIAAGIVAVTASVNNAKANIDSIEVPKYANGGLADKGSLFYAGEAGPELVTQTSGGGSTIMNMKQLEDAVAKGFIRGFAATDNGYESNDMPDIYIDGQRVFNIMRGVARRNGYDFAKV